MCRCPQLRFRKWTRISKNKMTDIFVPIYAIFTRLRSLSEDVWTTDFTNNSLRFLESQKSFIIDFLRLIVGSRHSLINFNVHFQKVFVSFGIGIVLYINRNFMISLGLYIYMYC